MIEEILKEFDEKFNHIPNRGFIVGKKGGYYDNCAYNIADVSSWLKEKLSSFQKTTKTEFLKRILPEEVKINLSDIGLSQCGWNACRDEALINAEKDGVTLIK